MISICWGNAVVNEPGFIYKSDLSMNITAIYRRYFCIMMTIFDKIEHYYHTTQLLTCLPTR